MVKKIGWVLIGLGIPIYLSLVFVFATDIDCVDPLSYLINTGTVLIFSGIIILALELCLKKWFPVKQPKNKNAAWIIDIVIPVSVAVFPLLFSIWLMRFIWSVRALSSVCPPYS